MISKKFKKKEKKKCKCKFAKVKEIICNIPIDTEYACNILTRPIDSNGLIILKQKRDLEYCAHVYFEKAQTASVYTALRYLKTENKFYEEINISNNVFVVDVLGFSSQFSQGTDNQEHSQKMFCILE